MNTNDHKKLAQFIIENSDGFEKNSFKRAFVFGSIEPDYNVLSYLKGSFRHTWLRGHHYMNSLNFLKRSIKKLESKDKSQWNSFDYFRLGKVVHYMADDFTCAHNESFTGDLSEHCVYEGKLSDYFNEYMQSYKPDKKKINIKSEFTAFVEKAHEAYAMQKHKLQNDTQWIFRMCWITACHFVSPASSAV